MKPSLPNAKAAVEFILQNIPGEIRLGTPLGLGKPNVLLNELYGYFKNDVSRSIEIYTALSLDLPESENFLAERFFTPFLQRHFGKDYPRLDYVKDLKSGMVPSNIRVHEFYMQASQYRRGSDPQRNYISLNYTHAAATLLDRGLNIIVQLVSRSPDGKYSLSCNPDLTLDLRDMARDRGTKLMIVAVVHPQLPFLGGDAVVDDDFFDAVVESTDDSDLFALPRMPIDPISHLIGLHASQLVADDGTIQIGIGSLTEALGHCLVMRHTKNADYSQALSIYGGGSGTAAGIFEAGLYGTSEMVMDTFMHLRRAGILKRTVKDKHTRESHYLHGGFFLGSREFYAWLNSLHGDDLAGIAMTRISKVNDLYDADELALRRQRKNARFFNTCMKVSLLGGVISDTLDDGFVVSGVGGQFNFVAMSHELAGAQSVLMLKSTRFEKGKRKSNIIAAGGHLTIPRHLRDVVVTEYGAAFLKGRTDEECIQALLAICDAEFQEELAQEAKQVGKLSREYRIPDSIKKNTPARLLDFHAQVADQSPGFFPDYPFGTEFTPVEQTLITALENLKLSPPSRLLRYFWKGGVADRFSAELSRMGLSKPSSWKERLYRRVILGALTHCFSANG